MIQIPSKEKKVSFYRTMLPLFQIALKKCTSVMVFLFILYIVYGLSSVVITYCTQQFFDLASISIEQKTIMAGVWGAFVLMLLSILANHILNGAQNYISTIIHIRLNGIYQGMLNDKAGKISPIYYENQNFLQMMEKAANGATPGGATFMVISLTVVLFCYLPYIIFMGFYLFQLQPMLVLALVLIFVPVLLTQILKVTLYDKLEDETVQTRREYTYIEDCMIGKGHKETRTLGAYSFFAGLYRASIQKLINKEWKTQRKAIQIDILMNGLTLLGYLGVLGLLLYYVLRGDISIGTFGAVFGSIDIMFEYMRSMINQQIGGMSDHLGVTSNFIYFLNLPIEEGKELVEKFNTDIALDRISFRYPDSTESAIDDLSLTIKKGETIAVVGENGAGKSTLIRLISGLYHPDAGTVSMDGRSLKDCSSQSLFHLYSGVFQNFQRYKMTLADNISISQSEKPVNNGEIDSLINQVHLQQALSQLHQGVDTMLSVEFDGVDLSGGEWQRVAFARGLYRNHSIIILDEPTSAIDPIEERQIYNQFVSMTKGKTAIIVTHRLGSARIADRILVMRKGKVVEDGTHDSLMDQNGYYAEMFHKQAIWYQKGESTTSEQ